ncbi:hypothetical protein RM553_19540, partial [Zunongwangia sp. F363]
ANMLKKIFVSIIVLILLSFSNEKFEQLKFEKQVAYEVFPQLIDSIHSDSRIKVPIPPPPIENGTNPTETIPLRQIYKDLERQEKELYKDTVKLVTAIVDSTIILSKEDKLELINHFELKQNHLDTSNIDFRYKIDLKKLKADKKIRFKYRSELPDGKKIWKTDYDFYLNSVISFSRIQFDRTNSYGVMTAHYTSGPLSGGSFRIFIKKDNDKWIIDWIDLTAVA